MFTHLDPADVKSKGDKGQYGVGGWEGGGGRQKE